jgi:hypothetical protein
MTDDSHLMNVAGWLTWLACQRRERKLGAVSSPPCLMCPSVMTHLSCAGRETRGTNGGMLQQIARQSSAAVRACVGLVANNLRVGIWYAAAYVMGGQPPFTSSWVWWREIYVSIIRSMPSLAALGASCMLLLDRMTTVGV